MKTLDLTGRRMLFWDGGLGSQLQARGLKGGELPETWNVTHPQDVTEIHRAYLEAGADLINANTFGANRLKYPEGGAWNLEELVAAAFENAKKARILAGKPEACIALDIGPTGHLLEPLGDLSFEEAVSAFAQVMRIGKKCGADLVMIETMSDIYEVKAAVLAAKEETNLPVFVTMVFGESGKLLTGTTPAAAAAAVESMGADAFGVNCGLGPVQMKTVAKELMKTASVPVIVNPNAGLPRTEREKTVYDVKADEFAQVMKEIAEDGAWMIGGCCGTTPEYIRKTVELCRNIRPKNEPFAMISRICASEDVLELGKTPILVGNRMDPRVNEEIRDAFEEEDFETLTDEAMDQEDCGASVIALGGSGEGEKETEVFADAVSEVQSMMRRPLFLHASSPKMLEAALRRYNGKALAGIDSKKEEDRKALFLLVKKYGGMAVVSLDTEKTKEEILSQAEGICLEALRAHVRQSDLMLDLSLAGTEDPEMQKKLLSVIKTWKEERKVPMSAGLLSENAASDAPDPEFAAELLKAGLAALAADPEEEELTELFEERN